MRTNHRRKQGRHSPKREGCGCGFMRAYSLRDWKRAASTDRRAEERELMSHGRWDDLPPRYPKNILWNYW